LWDRCNCAQYAVELAYAIVVLHRHLLVILLVERNRSGSRRSCMPPGRTDKDISTPTCGGTAVFPALEYSENVHKCFVCLVWRFASSERVSVTATTVQVIEKLQDSICLMYLLVWTLGRVYAGKGLHLWHKRLLSGWWLVIPIEYRLMERPTCILALSSLSALPPSARLP